MGKHAGERQPNRREFLVGGAGAGLLGLGLAFTGRLDFLFGGDPDATAAAPSPGSGAGTQAAASRAALSGGGGTTPAKGARGLMADPAGRLALPPGFTYTVIAHEGVSRLDSGELTPGLPDGMGAFATPDGGTALVTNHEIKWNEHAQPVPTLPLLTYDPGCKGGTTTVLLDFAGARTGEYVSLAGTEDNCAGGITPWGTWLTCEESESRAGSSGRRRDHGYVFEVDPLDRAANLNPAPIKALGRFPHEAAAVNPGSGEVYLTEDAAHPNGLLYRWAPPAGYAPGKGALRRLGPEDGKLTALRAYDGHGKVVADLSVAVKPGTSYDIEWVPVPDRDARLHSTRKQFAYGDRARDHAEVSRARKLEGAWWADGGLYFVSSYAKPKEDGSPRAHGGQVWFLRPDRGEITLVLRYAPRGTGDDIADGPDNITVSPYGGVVIAEDGDGGQHLLGATPLGETFYIARNEIRLPTGKYSEFAGPVFSADKRTLFTNLQESGLTFAITGPWHTLAAQRHWKSMG